MLDERRRHQRVPCLLPLRITVLGIRPVTETLTKDLSLGGLRCLSPQGHPVSTRVSLELSLGTHYPLLTTQGKVVWLESLPESEQFHLGISFSSLTEHDTRHLSLYIEKISLRSS